MNLTEIKLFVSKEFQGKFRRDGVTPYFTHLERVAARIRANRQSLTARDRLEKIAYLHDILEDTDVTASQLLAKGIDPEVVEAVQLLTKDPYDDYIDYITEITGNTYARTVKVADMLDNLSDSPTCKQIKKYAQGLLILLGD